MSKARKCGIAVLAAVFAAAMLIGFSLLKSPARAFADAAPITTTFSTDMDPWKTETAIGKEMVYDSAVGGYLKLSLNGATATIVMDNIAIDTAQYKAMAMRVKYDLQDPAKMAHPSLGNRFSIYYQTESVGYGSALYWPDITEEAQSGEWETVVIDFTDNANKHPDLAGATKWEGTVSKFRLDAIWSEGDFYTPGDSVSIDFIKFYPDKAAAEAELASGWEDDATVEGKGSEMFFNFTKGAQGWEHSINNANGSGQTADGEIKVVLGNDDPQIKRSWEIGVSLDDYRYLAFRMKNGTAGSKSKIYFATKASAGYDESKTGSTAVTPNSDYGVYVFDMSENAAWTGILKDLRFDVIDDAGVASSGEVLIDWIGFYRTAEEIPAADWEDDDLSVPDGPVVEFNFTDSAQGWSANEDAAAANSYNALQLTMAEGKDDPNITYVFADGLKTSTYPILQVKMRNRTAGTQFNVYFAGEGEAIDGTKVATFSVSADDAAYQIYTFNLAAASSWSDADVYTLRIDPTDKGNGEVLIDYIRFYRSESEAELNGAYEDDSVERPNAHTEFNFNLHNTYWTNASSTNANVTNENGCMVIEVKQDTPPRRIRMGARRLFGLGGGHRRQDLELSRHQDAGDLRAGQRDFPPAVPPQSGRRKVRRTDGLRICAEDERVADGDHRPDRKSLLEQHDRRASLCARRRGRRGGDRGYRLHEVLQKHGRHPGGRRL